MSKDDVAAQVAQHVKAALEHLDQVRRLINNPDVPLTMRFGHGQTILDQARRVVGNLGRWAEIGDPMAPAELLDGWLRRARFAASLAADEPWPGWSTTELLAVALILDDMDQLAAMDYTRVQALDRLRHEIEEPSVEAAAAVFARLSKEVAR